MNGTAPNRSSRPGGVALDHLALWGPALGVLALHLAFATTFGIFRDELYYLSCARRLAWGYVDHPPLVALVTRVWTTLLGDGLFTLRALAAISVAGAVALTSATARTMGGSRFATALAGLAMGLSPVILSLGSIWTMNAIDLLVWAAAFRVLAAILGGGDERLWWLFGLVCGVGLENKASVLFLGFGAVAGLVADRRWAPFQSRRFWEGGALAALVVVPHLLWQQRHGWPTLEFMANAARDKNVDFAPLAFLGAQLEMTGPVNALVWLAGLAALLATPALRRFRALGFAWLAILAVMLSTAAKPYYLAAAYAALWAAGAVAIERATGAWRAASWARGAVAVVLVATALAIAPLARPMLPVEATVRYAAALGERPGTDERHRLGRLKQFYADMQEWRELAEAVAVAAAKLSPEERASACVFGQNYGEAGAVERFGRELGLPPAISAHNSWFLWGPGDCAQARTLLVMADRRERLEELFESVEPAAIFDCRDCMPYEDGQTIWIARDPKVSLADLWPRIKHFE